MNIFVICMHTWYLKRIPSGNDVFKRLAVPVVERWVTFYGRRFLREKISQRAAYVLNRYHCLFFTDITFWGNVM